jgi:glycosyltransferase involved in cell wall biosynthesis
VSQPIRKLLFFPREPYPTDRVRINVLFGAELGRRGYRIDLVTQAADESVAPGKGTWPAGEAWIGPTDLADGFLHRIRKHALGLLHDLRSLRLMRPDLYDAVLVADKFVLGTIGILVARRRRIRFIFWLTFPYPEVELLGASEKTARYPWLARIRGGVSAWFLYRWILPRSDHVFAQSERMKSNFCAQGIDPAKISCIVTGFGLSEIHATAQAEARQPHGSITLSYLGTLGAERQLGVLIDMLALLRREKIDVKLLLVGHADRARDAALLREHAQRLGVEPQMEITGFLPQQEALRRIASSHICLSPIFRSPIFDVGSPTKLIEYMALGMPVVANDHPEQKAILAESRCGVCVPWSGRHFARAVRWLLKRTPQERAAMGQRGREWVVANRTYASIADEVEQVFRRLPARAAHRVAQ